MYLHGNGVEKDVVRAFELLKEMVEKEYKPAMFLLGHLHLVGSQVEQDKEYGLSLLKQTADNGYVDSLVYLSCLFRDGVLVPCNPKEAFACLVNISKEAQLPKRS